MSLVQGSYKVTCSGPLWPSPDVVPALQFLDLSHNGITGNVPTIYRFVKLIVHSQEKFH